MAAVSQKHVNQIFLDQFSPLRLAREGLRGAPELLDALAKAPMLVTEGLRLLERTTQQPSTNPLAGVRSALLAGACLVGGVIVLTLKGPMALWVVLFVLALVLAHAAGVGPAEAGHYETLALSPGSRRTLRKLA